MRITCKFGGTSLATAENINIAKGIVYAKPERSLVVVSAPGKRFDGDTKITDLLYQFPESWSEIEGRFLLLANQLNAPINMQNILDETKMQMMENNCTEFNLSRGEYLSARLMAAHLGFEFLDAIEIIEFDECGINLEKTRKNAEKHVKNSKNYVIPGFYGVLNGKVKILPRGGSDVSGAIVANIFGCEVYENWTDVNGFMTSDPRTNSAATTISKMSYNQCKKLSLAGANVLYHSAVDYAETRNISILNRNTFNPAFAGTKIGK